MGKLTAAEMLGQVVKGRCYTVGLGGHRFVSLAEARETAFENRKAARERARHEDARGRGHADLRGGRAGGALDAERRLEGDKTADDWRAPLALYAYPASARCRCAT